MDFLAIKKLSIPTKQEALYFDRILLKPNESDLPTDRERSKFEVENILSDLTFKYLEDYGVVGISKFSDYFDDEVQLKFWLRRNTPKGEDEEEEKVAWNRRMKKKLLQLNNEGKRKFENFINFLYMQNEIREMSLFLREQKGVDAVPLLDNDPWTLNVNNQNIKLGAVRVILNAIPVPVEDEVPWEQIIDIRQDEEARHKLIALRMWMRKAVSTASTITEIKEELEYLLYEYNKRMDIHKMKSRTGYIHALISAPVGIVKNLMNLDVNKIGEPLFLIRQTKIDLMEKELDTPGREVAYIRHIEEKLGGEI